MAGFPSLLDGALRGWARHDAPPFRKTEKSKFLKIAPRSRASASNPDHTADLARMVEAEIIPRLMLAHGQGSGPGAPGVAGSEILGAQETIGLAASAPAAPAATGADERLGPAATEAFTRMALSDDSQSLLAHVGGLLASGVPMETIYVNLMIPAARLLGDYWDDDSVSFADVTIGLGRLQQVVRTLRWRSPDGEEGPDHAAPSALFAPATSEQHTFGLFIIEETFRRAGWRTWIETSGVEDDAVQMVRSHWFDLIGFSAHCDAQIEAVAATISAVREASRNRGLFVLVGGRLFVDNPELVPLVGADATAPNGGEALRVADKAVRRLSHSAC